MDVSVVLSRLGRILSLIATSLAIARDALALVETIKRTWTERGSKKNRDQLQLAPVNRHRAARQTLRLRARRVPWSIRGIRELLKALRAIKCTTFYLLDGVVLICRQSFYAGNDAVWETPRRTSRDVHVM